MSVFNIAVKSIGFEILYIVNFFFAGYLKNPSSLAQQCSKPVPLGDNKLSGKLDRKPERPAIALGPKLF